MSVYDEAIHEIRKFNRFYMVNMGFLDAEYLDAELDAGAMIFFAVEDDTPLATCMAMPLEGRTWEICKLGSNKIVPHKGAGSAVFETSMKWALNHGADRLFILSTAPVSIRQVASNN